MVNGLPGGFKDFYAVSTSGAPIIYTTFGAGEIGIQTPGSFLGGTFA